MACDNCDVGCVMIEGDCLCKYTVLRNIDPYNHISIVNEINSIIEDLIGEDCLTHLCSDDGIDDRDTHKFKRFYAKLFEIEWLLEYGSGQVSAQGIVRKQGDDYSDYQVISYSEITKRVAAKRQSLERFEAAWIKEYTDKYPDCTGCEEELSCGCYATCNCKNNPSPNQIKNSNCGGGCTNCGCNNSELLDFTAI